MDELDSLKSSLSSKRSQLSAKQQERVRYLGVANEIDAVYQRMVADKRTIRGYRDSVNSFYKEKYDRFCGNLYKNTYLASIKQLISDYDTVINKLDTNVDRLNTAKAQWENKAYQCDGVIGYLRSAVNSLVHQIENWVN